jgi:hypothetical protein
MNYWLLRIVLSQIDPSHLDLSIKQKNILLVFVSVVIFYVPRAHDCIDLVSQYES